MYPHCMCRLPVQTVRTDLKHLALDGGCCVGIASGAVMIELLDSRSEVQRDLSVMLSVDRL